jgi:hypothetical protein
LLATRFKALIGLSPVGALLFLESCIEIFGFQLNLAEACHSDLPRWLGERWFGWEFGGRFSYPTSFMAKFLHGQTVYAYDLDKLNG